MTIHIKQAASNNCRGIFVSGATFLSLFTTCLSATIASALSKSHDSQEQDSSSALKNGIDQPVPNSSYEVKMVVVASSGKANSTVSTSGWDVQNSSLQGNTSMDIYEDLVAFCANVTLVEASNMSNLCIPPLPKSLYFTDDNAVAVITYSCLFVVAACGNLTVFITLFRNRGHKSRINMFIMHLAIADLIVTFIILPLEIAWHSTVSWRAGDLACRGLMFFRAMGFYLSSCIVVSISLDRYFAIMRPFSITAADTRARLMLVTSWGLSIVASIPQVRIFDFFYPYIR
ncbi:gonadotropin-releasing hormone ii receptor [Plakobranchus ocellatus]|uniref:Gonadotropin-releasing hormone ii receptor n=1 Tax=Plakobranchus ocellatus TaxID=259542 RepID=A0AAV4B6R4_9GAST|nr:gonadotropin-releasing hormone ii receptor [Plakobranchus ocellatus]